MRGKHQGQHDYNQGEGTNSDVDSKLKLDKIEHGDLEDQSQGGPCRESTNNAGKWQVLC